MGVFCLLLCAATLPVGRLGIGMECLDRDLWDPVPAHPALVELGIRRARLQSGWARTEKTKGVYDFAWLDRVVDRLVADGIEPWISLSYGNPIYAAACDGEQAYTGQKMNPLHSPEGLAAWLAYVRAIVGRYGDRVRVWEVWNEPDISHFFRPLPGKTWEDEYLELLRVTSEAVRSVSPRARVAACTALGPGGGERRTIGLFERGAGRYADIYTYHAYSERPEDFTAVAASAFYGAVRRLAPNIEFWRGEAGISSRNSGRGALSHLPLSETVQARWMSRHLVRDLHDRDLAFTSYFHLFDFDHYSHEVTYHYGVLRDGDYSRKPSYEVLRRIKRIFDDGTAEPDGLMSLTLQCQRAMTPAQTNLTDAIAVYPFRRGGHPLFAYSATARVTEDVPEFTVRAQAFFGNASETWRDPVVFDLVDGSVTRPPLVKDWPESKLRIKVTNHVRVLTEAAALAGHFDVGKPNRTLPKPSVSGGQRDRE